MSKKINIDGSQLATITALNKKSDSIMNGQNTTVRVIPSIPAVAIDVDLSPYLKNPIITPFNVVSDLDNTKRLVHYDYSSWQQYNSFKNTSVIFGRYNDESASTNFINDINSNNFFIVNHRTGIVTYNGYEIINNNQIDIWTTKAESVNGGRTLNYNFITGKKYRINYNWTNSTDAKIEIIFTYTGVATSLIRYWHSGLAGLLPNILQLQVNITNIAIIVSTGTVSTGGNIFKIEEKI